VFAGSHCLSVSRVRRRHGASLFTCGETTTFRTAHGPVEGDSGVQCQTLDGAIVNVAACCYDI